MQRRVRSGRMERWVQRMDDARGRTVNTFEMDPGESALEGLESEVFEGNVVVPLSRWGIAFVVEKWVVACESPMTPVCIVVESACIAAVGTVSPAVVERIAMTVPPGHVSWIPVHGQLQTPKKESHP